MTALRTVRATRYVTPLREGGSLPAIVEADDLGLYVIKFRGAGQGPLALVAELLAGELGRTMGLPVPELVFIEIDPALARNEPDEEIRDLLGRSAGLNLAVDYLPGSVGYDPAAGDTVAASLASRVVWFDALVMNVDRTPRNPNLLLWHRRLYLIDHGAALYFHHNWPSARDAALSSFAMIRHHILLPLASEIEHADRALRPLLPRSVLADLVEQLPVEWLAPEGGRAAYLEFFERRLQASQNFVEEAIQAHASLL